MIYKESYPTVEKALSRVDYLESLCYPYWIDHDEDEDQFIVIWLDSVKVTD